MNEETYKTIKLYEIIFRYYLREYDQETLNRMFNKDYEFYEKLMVIFSSLTTFDPSYFLINPKGEEKINYIISTRKPKADLESTIDIINFNFNNIESLFDSSKKVIIKKYAKTELNARFIDPFYTHKLLKEKSINTISKYILELQGFDYEYSKVLEEDKYYLIRKPVLRRFISSTNYMLTYFPYVYDDERLMKVRKTLEQFDDNYFARRTINNVDRHLYVKR